MKDRQFEHFGDLYRAAFAESDRHLKQSLLAAIKHEIDRWSESMQEEQTANCALAPISIKAGRPGSRDAA